MATEQLKIEIVLDDGQVKTGFIEVEKQAKKSAKSMESSFDGSISSLGASIKGLGVALAAAFAGAKFVGFLKDSAKSAMEAENAVNALSASLRQIGQLTSENVKSFTDFAAGLQKTTGVSDDLIVQNAALLASLGGLSGQGLERGTKAALDLAQALQIDVGTAFDLVAKAATGNTSALSRYGIRISESIPKNEKFAETLKLIESRFGGLSETRLNTLGGSLLNLSNAFGEVTESIGKFFTESPSLRIAIKFVSDAFFSLAESIDSIRGNAGDIFKPLINGAINLLLIVVEVFKAFEQGFNLVKIGVQAIILGFNSLAALLAQVPKLIAEYMIKPLADFVGFAADKVVGFFNAEAGAKLRANLEGFGSVVRDATAGEADNATSLMIQSFDNLNESVNGNFMSMGESAESWLVKLKTALNTAGVATKDLETNTNKGFKGVVKSADDMLKSMQSIVQNSLTNLISDSMQRIGASLVKGQDAFAGFNSAILNILGDFAIQVGLLVIGIGQAATTVASALTNFFTGPLAVVAGLALIALGGALKAIAGGPASASGGGGIASSPSASTELTPTQELTRQEPQTSVQVIVQGDILDSDAESGSRIVNLINKAFDKKGVVINRGVMA